MQCCRLAICKELADPLCLPYSCYTNTLPGWKHLFNLLLTLPFVEVYKYVIQNYLYTVT